jgi:hypothetical protein
MHRSNRSAHDHRRLARERVLPRDPARIRALRAERTRLLALVRRIDDQLRALGLLPPQIGEKTRAAARDRTHEKPGALPATWPCTSRAPRA